MPYDSLTNAKLSLAETMNVAPEQRVRLFNNKAREMFCVGEINARVSTAEAIASLDRGSPAFD